MSKIKPTVTMIVLAVLLCLRLCGQGSAGWEEHGTPVCTVDHFQSDAKSVSDGEGGVIICWYDERDLGYVSDVYAQRFDAYGNAMWAADGVAVCTAVDDQWYPNIASDGEGGAIICWHDDRAGAYWAIFAQRVDASGNILWAPDGVEICSELVADTPLIAPDDSGGAIIVWPDLRADTATTDIYAQRVDRSGNVLWAPDGITVHNSTPDSTELLGDIIADGTGGVIVCWQTGDLYGQRLTRSGSRMWAPLQYGRAICTASDEQINPRRTFTPSVPVLSGVSSIGKPTACRCAPLPACSMLRGLFPMDPTGLSYAGRTIAPVIMISMLSGWTRKATQCGPPTACLSAQL
jgi:hypothetical protein